MVLSSLRLHLGIFEALKEAEGILTHNEDMFCMTRAVPAPYLCSQEMHPVYPENYSRSSNAHIDGVHLPLRSVRAVRWNDLLYGSPGAWKYNIQSNR